jgi:hypothetical protein
MSNIELIVALLIPVAVLTLLRINAAMVFLSLCLGYVLVQFVANDADSLISFVAPNSASVSASTLRLAMLFTPAVVTALIMLFSVKGKMRTICNFFPAVGTSILALLLAVPLCTPGLRYTIEFHTYWKEISKAQAMLVGMSAFVSLLFLWATRKSSHGAERGHRRR